MYSLESLIAYLKQDIKCDIIEFKKCKFKFASWFIKGRIQANKEVLAKLESIVNKQV